MNEPKPGVMILGGRSDIGLAAAHAFARAGHPVMLAAREAQSLAADCQDISLRYGAGAQAVEFDVLASSALPEFAGAGEAPPGIVVCVVGLMGDQRESELDPAAAARVMRSNFEGPALILGLYAERMAALGRGTIVGVSSVAGDRGRASNYVYGAAKAGFTAFLSGLRNRLARQGVQVITVKPGFVATRMTEGLDLPRALTAAPEEVAEAILHAVERGRDVVYVRPVWRMIMAIIRILPERLFKKTSL
ncbi:SDR family oxidoreductase [Leisingera sp. S232]|uniref:SDR family oxidoreductase n=1 Tax=Leisingera sp. S232 TaxID=3415132 RepID=UPI00086A97B5|nr:short-chain dehydrogenase [Rhodobacteraceae bacterium (ex Bugula neritina AB1)]